MRDDKYKNDDSSLTMATPKKACAVCAATTGGQGKPLFRCTQCKSQYYCSRQCQKADWKSRHKKACQYLAQRNKAVEAWNELEQIMQTTSRPEAAQNFHRAKDEMASLGAEEDGPQPNQDNKDTDDQQHNIIKQETSTGCEHSTWSQNEPPNISSPPVSAASKLDANKTTKTITSDESNGKKEQRFSLSFDSSDTRVGAQVIQQGVNVQTSVLARADNGPDSGSKANGEESPFDFYIEEFPHLSCYQLDLSAKSTANDCAIELHNWSIRISTDVSKQVSTISLYNALCKHNLVFCVPGRVKDTLDSVSVVNGRLSMRLSLEATSEPLVQSKRTSTEVANQLSCSGCGRLLLCDKDTPRIQRVLPLPSGLWDDMSDYLVCFEGQPSIDFTSSSTEAKRGLVLEDATVLVYHFDDVAPNLQVLAIPGYGEGQEDDDINDATEAPSRVLPLVRGKRSWSDAIGGATVACSCCCLVLGVAPVDLTDTVRLFKHRVETEQQAKLTSVLTFCVHSMIRYAEGKAFFSFLVRDQTNPHLALVLQLIGWEGKATREYKDEALGELAWSKLAKILYEQRDDIPLEKSSLENTFVWTQGDWCCPPQGGGGAAPTTTMVREEKKMDTMPDLPTSSVCLWLETDEWNHLKVELQLASTCYSKEVASATFLAKNARLPERGPTSGLAAVFLE